MSRKHKKIETDYNVDVKISERKLLSKYKTKEKRKYHKPKPCERMMLHKSNQAVDLFPFVENIDDVGYRRALLVIDGKAHIQIVAEKKFDTD